MVCVDRRTGASRAGLGTFEIRRPKRYARPVRRPSCTASSSLRASTCALCLAFVLALACAGAPAALAAGTSEGNALSELTKEEPTSSSTTATATTSTETKTSEPSNSSSTILIATAVAVVFLCGIAFVIVRDARRVAPAGDSDLIEERAGRDTAVMMRKRRAKAKAARQQRKRNR